MLGRVTCGVSWKFTGCGWKRGDKGSFSLLRVADVADVSPPGPSFMSRISRFCSAGGLAQLQPVGPWGASLTPDPEVLGQHQGQKLDLSPGPQGL